MRFIKKNFYLVIIFIGLSLSVYNSISNVKSFDKYRITSEGNPEHMIIRSDIRNLWVDAAVIKKDLESGKSFFKSGREYTRTYLPPILIASYYIVIKKNIFNSYFNMELLKTPDILKDYQWKRSANPFLDKKIFETNNSKVGILIIQSILYYLALFFLFKKLGYFFSNRMSIFILTFLALEPTIFQWHSAFWTESLYLFFLIIFLNYSIRLSKKNITNFIFGLFIGLMYMHKTTSMFLLIPVFIYYFSIFKFSFVKHICFVLIGFLLMISIIGTHNYSRAGIFYVSPFQAKEAPWGLISHIINANTENITETESFKKKIEHKEKWMIENNINIEKETDRRKLLSYQSKYFVNSVIKNPIYAIKLHIWKSFQTAILDPNWAKKEYFRDKSVDKYWKKDGFNADLNARILYSSFIYLISLIGLVNLLKDKKTEKKFIFFLLLIIAYFMVMLGWTGISRYSVTCLIFTSIFFASGFEYLLQKFKLISK